MANERLENLKGRLTPKLEARIRDAIATGAAPRALLTAFSAAAMKQLTEGSAPLEGLTEVAALEAIVQRFGRPPLLVRNKSVVIEPLDDLPAGTDALIKNIEYLIDSVGRVEFVNSSMDWGGTGWIVDIRGDRALVVTNRHVAQVVARRRSDGTGVFMRATNGARYGANIDFAEEVDSVIGNGSDTTSVLDVVYLADDVEADVALLAVTADGIRGRRPIELHEGGSKKGDLVAIIGYPAYDSRNDSNDQARYFRDLYEVKRFAPGLIVGTGDGATLTHDCTSLGGNSGSPLIHIESGLAMGLHFSGEYGIENTAVTAKTLAKLLKGERPVFVNLGQQMQAEGAADGHHEAAHFEGRVGFDIGFLKAGGPFTPWPSVRADLACDLAVPDPATVETNEIAYTHFGVKYSAVLKLPLLTAVNVDGANSVRIKRGNDRWFTDGRIPHEIQLLSRNFADSKIDRGHMVRREDPNWETDGSAGQAAQANADTFHYVNAAAQHSELNQGKSLWQGLENYILESARTHGFRACVFTGPVLRDVNDAEAELVVNGAIVPLEFWKLVVTLDKDGKDLHATAYLLSQGQLVRALIEKRSRRESLEGFVLGEYRTFQIAISDLADATGYDFSAYVGSDPLRSAASSLEAPDDSEPLVIPLDALSDVVL